MESEVNGSLIVNLVKKILLKVILVSVCIGVGFAYLKLQMNEKEYISSGELVQNDNNYNLIDPYKQFVGSNRFTNLLNDEVQDSIWKKLKSKGQYTVSIESSGEKTTPFFSLSVSSENGRYSKFLTSRAIKIFNANIGKYLSGANITIVSKASSARSANNGSLVVKWFSYGFLTAFIVFGVLFSLKYFFFGKIKETNFINEVFGLNNLGNIEVKREEK